MNITFFERDIQYRWKQMQTAFRNQVKSKETVLIVTQEENSLNQKR